MSFAKNGRHARSRSGNRQQPVSLPDGYLVQVHFAGIPGTTKRILNALRRESHEHLTALKNSGHLVLAGRYFSSVGGVWILKVRHIPDAEKLVREYPPVKQNLLTYRLNVLVDLDQVPQLASSKGTALEPA